MTCKIFKDSFVKLVKSTYVNIASKHFLRIFNKLKISKIFTEKKLMTCKMFHNSIWWSDIILKDSLNIKKIIIVAYPVLQFFMVKFKFIYRVNQRNCRALQKSLHCRTDVMTINNQCINFTWFSKAYLQNMLFNILNGSNNVSPRYIMVFKVSFSSRDCYPVKALQYLLHSTFSLQKSNMFLSHRNALYHDTDWKRN